MNRDFDPADLLEGYPAPARVAAVRSEYLKTARPRASLGADEPGESAPIDCWQTEGFIEQHANSFWTKLRHAFAAFFRLV
jgi:hypothetical protein